jgi:hypothetical protein
MKSLLASGLALALMAGLVSTAVFSADPDKEKEWERLATPGTFHKKLDPLVGDWNVTMTCFEKGVAKPEITKGKATRKLILGNRFVEERLEGEAHDKPFNGLGVFGYDNGSKKYESVWCDTASTCLMTMTGTIDDAGKVFTYTPTFDDPITGKPSTGRILVTIVNRDENKVEMLNETPEGKEIKLFEAVYTRTK